MQFQILEESVSKSCEDRLRARKQGLSKNCIRICPMNVNICEISILDLYREYKKSLCRKTTAFVTPNVGPLYKIKSSPRNQNSTKVLTTERRTQPTQCIINWQQRKDLWVSMSKRPTPASGPYWMTGQYCLHKGHLVHWTFQPVSISEVIFVDDTNSYSTRIHGVHVNSHWGFSNVRWPVDRS